MKCENYFHAPRDAESHLSSVFNAMRLMKIFSAEYDEIGLSDLSRQLELPKSSVHRLATALVESNMLIQDEDSGKYRLGLLMFELASLMERKQSASSEKKRRPGMAAPTLPGKQNQYMA